MSLVEKIDDYFAKKSDVCAFALLLGSMPERDRNAIENAINKGIPGAVIIKFIKADGYKTSSDSYRAHAKKTCKCYWEKN
jgi:hypothetical protein